MSRPENPCQTGETAYTAFSHCVLNNIEDLMVEKNFTCLPPQMENLFPSGNEWKSCSDQGEAAAILHFLLAQVNRII